MIKGIVYRYYCFLLMAWNKKKIPVSLRKIMFTDMFLHMLQFSIRCFSTHCWILRLESVLSWTTNVLFCTSDTLVKIGFTRHKKKTQLLDSVQNLPSFIHLDKSQQFGSEMSLFQERCIPVRKTVGSWRREISGKAYAAFSRGNFTQTQRRYMKICSFSTFQQ